MYRQSFAKYASMISRGGNRFFDQELASYSIGCGQQFFLSQIADNSGISMYDLARLGNFDKATVTRAVQKLCESHYITCTVDENDRRVRRLYPTVAAEPVLKRLHELYEEWSEILTDGLSYEEIQAADAILAKIAGNASKYGKERND